MSAAVRAYIARSVVRHDGALPANFAENLRRNVRRRYGRSLGSDDADALSRHFREVYACAAAALPGFLGRAGGRRADFADVRKDPFLRHLAAHFPGEPREALEVVAWYVVLYEHVK